MMERFVVYRKIAPKNSDSEYEDIRCGRTYYYFNAWEGMTYNCYTSINSCKIFNDREEAIKTYKALKKHPLGKKYDWKINKLPKDLIITAGNQLDINEKNNLRGIK